MKKLTFTILFILFFVFTCFSQGANVNLSDYTTPADTDITSELQTAFNDVKAAGGGTVNIDAGVWQLDGEINLVASNDYVSYKLQGNYGAVLQLALSQTETAFSSGNVNALHIDGLIVIGLLPTGTDYDAKTFLSSGFTDLTRITNCQFLGLKFKENLTYTTNTDLIIDSCYFGGIATDLGMIYALNFNGVTFSNNKVLDYGTLKNVFYNKASFNGGAWIKAENNIAIGIGTNFQKLKIIDSRFDEAAINAIHLKDIVQAQIINVAVNVNNGTNASAVLLDNVSFVKVDFCAFGYSNLPRPAIKATNNSYAMTSNIKLGASVFLATVDATSKVLETF